MNTNELTDFNTEAEMPTIPTDEESKISETVTNESEPEKNYIAKWQEQLGVKLTGSMNGQDPMYAPFIGKIEHIYYNGGGSDLVKAIQNVVGSGVSGYFDMNTARQLQKWLIRKGYDCGPYQADGIMGPDSLKALIQSIEDEAWKR